MKIWYKTGEEEFLKKYFKLCEESGFLLDAPTGCRIEKIKYFQHIPAHFESYKKDLLEQIK